jgi:alkylation response protein AidB-like acyl-CoA dehydrogenase
MSNLPNYKMFIGGEWVAAESGEWFETFDPFAGRPWAMVARDCGAEANRAKLLAADASWAAADKCVQTYGGFGFAEQFDIERKLRETRLYQVAPISTNLILSYLAEHVLGLPRSY